MQTILTALILASQVAAGSLLVPSSDVAFKHYSKRCLEADFICTIDYFLSLLKEKSTPQFDKLMDSVDVNSEIFRERLRNNIVQILNTEDLDRVQLTMLLKLLEQINQIQKTFLLTLIENELRRLSEVINRAPAVNKSEFIFIFKETLPLAEVANIRTTFLKIPFYFLHYSSIPYRTNTFDYDRIKRKPLLAGSCGKNNMTYKIESSKLCNKITIAAPRKELHY